MRRLKKCRTAASLLAFIMMFLFLVPETPVLAGETAEDVEERVLFVGDSRAVDMFSAGVGEIIGKKKNGIRVYARDGATFSFLEESVNRCKLSKFDTLVVWMGTNDSGDFSRYENFYNQILKKKKRIILCTVGPIDDARLSSFWAPYFSNARTACQYNASLNKWAQKKKVTVIPTYNYIKKRAKFKSDGIHYEIPFSKKVWKYIRIKLEAADVNLP